MRTMTTPTRVSVVVSTYNRAAGLRATLEGLRHQTYDDFEVVVVNGPSTDDTAAVVAEYADRVRAGECPEPSLTRSRNVGIAIASGDVIAFIDDDAIPEPTWVADILSGYDEGSTGGVGGIVYDHTGLRLQYKYSVCSRIGEPRWDVEPPLDAYVVPGSDPFLYLQGTNQSYLRRHLVEVGGFNENLAHYFDDCEIAMQVIDAGHRLRALPIAGVHHKYMASSVRDHQRVLIDPYRVIRDRFCFALTGCVDSARATTTDALVEWADTMLEVGRSQRDAGQLTAEQFDYYGRRVDEAVATALAWPGRPERPRREIAEPDATAFRPYPTVRTAGRRLTICLLSKEYPPDDFGGVGRLTADFASEFAARGHEVHVVTESRDIGRVDFERGVWVHRLELGEPLVAELADVPIGANLGLVRAMYGEVSRIHERGTVDLVVGALWLAQGLMCSLDPRFATVLLLESGTRTITDFHPSWEAAPHIRELIALEGALFRNARHLHAISRDILSTVQAQYGSTDAEAFVIPLGRHDDRARFRRQRAASAPLRVLFVSRLERRKGVDVLLPVAARLVRAYPHVEFVLAGKDTENTELGETYTAAFRREFGNDREVMSRVKFSGWLSEDELGQAYADADVFCLPARYESLGLVVIEAMSFGLPIVTSDVGGLAEIVEPEESGLLVPVEDASALEAALRRLIDDEALRRRLGERARRVFEERFALARTIPRTLEALERVAVRRSDGGRPSPIDREEARREVGRRLRGIVAEVTGATPERAEAISAALLDESWHARRVVQALEFLWPRDDQEFVTGLYPLLLGRTADPTGVRHWTALVRGGYPRLDVVQALATCEEAVARKLDVAWLATLPDALGLGETAAVSRPARRASARTRAFVTKLPSYLASAAYLPTNVRDLRTEAAGARAAQDRLERALRDHTARQVRVEQKQTRLEERQAGLEEVVSHRVLPGIDEALVRSAALLERTDAAARAQEAQAVALGQQMEAQAHGVQQVAGSLSMLSDWVSLLQKKMEMLALDLREQVSTRREPEEWPEPRVVDADRLRHKVAAMGGRLRLNLGCGEKALEHYVNVDFRGAPHVDIVADVRRLPFEDASVYEIASSHLVEHFRRHHFATVVLPYWSRLLQPGGLLRTTCPNWKTMLERLQRGEMTLADFTTVTFGAQDYCGDDHFSMYTPETLIELLERHGFGGIEVVAEARQNGLCPEMEIVARRDDRKP
jgi:glycogen(starch) synthase